MERGISSVLIILIICLVGIVCDAKKQWPENTAGVLSAVVIKVAAPTLVVYSIYHNITVDLLSKAGLLILLSLIHMIVMFLLGFALSRALKLDRKKAAVFIVSYTFTNVIFIGLPINRIVFGTEGITYLLSYYVVSITLFWSLGSYLLNRVADTDSIGSFGLRRLLNPGIVGVAIGIVIVLLNLTLPLAIDKSLEYLSAMCVPLSILVVGINIKSYIDRAHGVTADTVLMMLGKFIVSPLVMFGLLYLFQIEGLPAKVLLLTAAMPCHMQTSILAVHFNVEGDYAAKYVGVSTLLSLITIPCYVTLLDTISFAY